MKEVTYRPKHGLCVRLMYVWGLCKNVGGDMVGIVMVW